MKIRAVLILGIVCAQALTGCPTCIGRLELQSPAFFSDELYRLDSDEINDQHAMDAVNGNDSDDDDD